MDKRTIEGIESCRPGSDDLRQRDLSDVADRVAHDGEARECFERTQQWDAKVVAAMHQVEVPLGLAARLLTALAGSSADAYPASSHGMTEALLPVDVPSHTDMSVQLPDASLSRESTPSRWSRRQWIGTLATVAAGLFLALLLSNLRTGESEPLENIAGVWQKSLGPDWRDMQQAPGGFPLPGGLMGTPTGWQWIDRQMQVQGVAYQLQDAHGHKATLYVVHLNRPDAPNAAPLQPQAASVWAVGYWQRGKNVYVLVTRDAATYRRFVNPSPAPLA
jgi:hypothetical protein